MALVLDLGRPERFLNMLRTIKVTSPMSVGSWILALYSAGAGVTAAIEVDRMTGERIPLGPLRRLLPAVDVGAGLWAAAFAPPLAAYTAVLLADTANPTWNAARDELPFVFVSSAALASGGLAMITTPVEEAGPARKLAVLGAAVEIVATKVMHRRMDPVAAEPLHHGQPGKLLKWSEILTVAGGVGALLSGRHRVIAVASGVSLLAASALTRFGVFEAGIALGEGPAVHDRTAEASAGRPPRGRHHGRFDHDRRLRPADNSGSTEPRAGSWRPKDPHTVHSTRQRHRGPSAGQGP